MIHVWFVDPQPSSWFWRILCCLTRYHVMIGDGECVLHPGMHGVRYWAHEYFIAGYPGIRHGFRFNGGYDWQDVPKPERFPWFRVIARTVTGGRWPRQVDDCLGIALWALRREGYDVPRSVITPIALKEWCEREAIPAASSRAVRRQLGSAGQSPRGQATARPRERRQHGQ